MRYLADKGLTRPETQRELLGNLLVPIAPKASATALRIAPGFALSAAPGTGRPAICNAAAPCGKYALAALQGLNVWDSVQAHTAQAENVRAAQTLASRGEAPLGIV
jgi:molybdate transport system substrate-binding protein